MQLLLIFITKYAGTKYVFIICMYKYLSTKYAGMANSLRKCVKMSLLDRGESSS